MLLPGLEYKCVKNLKGVGQILANSMKTIILFNSFSYGHTV